MSDEPNLTTVRDHRAQLARLRGQIDAEDSELEVAERALTRLAVSTTTAPVGGSVGVPFPNGNGTDFPPMGTPRSVANRVSDRLAIVEPTTQRDLVISTLRHRAEPWVQSSSHLLDEIHKTHGVSIKPTSFLPLLTTLKNEGTIRRDAENRIALAERVNG